VFSFTLPLYGARAQARGPVVVIAVAEAGMRRELRRVAEGLGFAVQEAVDGVEAVEAVTRLRPVAAVLDRILPRLRAEDVAERLRLTAATSSVPLLAVADPADLGARAALFRAFLARPLDRAAVAEALSAVAVRPAPTA
jgi:CheY-like chemotaxis protein